MALPADPEDMFMPGMLPADDVTGGDAATAHQPRLVRIKELETIRENGVLFIRGPLGKPVALDM